MHHGIETCGGTGESPVKGVVMKLAVIALSASPGDSAQSIEIEGGVTTHGEGIAAFDRHGAIGMLRDSGFATLGGASTRSEGSEGVEATSNGAIWSTLRAPP